MWNIRLLSAGRSRALRSTIDNKKQQQQNQERHGWKKKTTTTAEGKRRGKKVNLDTFSDSLSCFYFASFASSSILLLGRLLLRSGVRRMVKISCALLADFILFGLRSLFFFLFSSSSRCYVVDPRSLKPRREPAHRKLRLWDKNEKFALGFVFVLTGSALSTSSSIQRRAATTTKTQLSQKWNNFFFLRWWFLLYSIYTSNNSDDGRRRKGKICCPSQFLKYLSAV